MELLSGAWIPVRPIEGGASQTVRLADVLCSQQRWILSLPRDDMELAALQLLICLIQISWIPEDDDALRRYLTQPLSPAEFEQGIRQWGDMFRLDHPDSPCLQVKGVSAKEATGMDKLMAGLTGATNCTFVNEPNQAEALCGGCAAIALFNQANNAPSFGGGFKSGLRGGSPVTTLIQAVEYQRADLRTTLWLNVLTRPRLMELLGDDLQLHQPPTWQQPIKEGAVISAGSIGLLRGLFWQPDHIELCSPIGEGCCTGCGQQAPVRYNGFLKAKFGFTVEGTWPHPHSPRLLQTKKGVAEEKFLAFTTSAPSWTQLGRVLVRLDGMKGEAQFPAAVVAQCQQVFERANTHLMIGGYRNNQASILERRHDVMAVHHGWQTQGVAIQTLVDIGLGYKTALRKALFTFAEGVKNTDLKGAGVAVHEVAERDYFRRSDLLITDLLANLNFNDPLPQLDQLRTDLRQLCVRLFEQVTLPYAHHPKLVRVLAVARRSLSKHLSELQPPQGDHNVA
ncbi:type I-E CRISPR-associated protein Cse1/CasA [Pokkaliibacter plantistimulans]|uniref:Type I-E CRISPR-associated protein Cse1/CasA n=1 Tax=Proteobacteria bacterium 228 TaxID=2083153 RepID=A0A2S5KKM4_9PROT|nr:type I-E CRISPR-associated protein Cse1/CasA [Pokkaliibacter plantistimulans]PPC75069.1 type I-E CRISPR-associated protein Cse1/CasA [Pokkaliibacter plantistimulans]